MVRSSIRRLPLLALTFLIAAVGIAPRRGGSDSRDERSSQPAQSPAPSAPAPSAPAPSGSPPGVSPRVRIAPRVEPADPTPGPTDERFRGRPDFSNRPGRNSDYSPSATGPVGIRRREGIENVPRRHYWHEYQGRRYSHFYDGRVHWYGYPYGESFFWMRPHAGLWWAYDDNFSRWVYWNDGFWWWPGPGGAQFVYVHDGYYPYASVRRAAEAAPPASPDANGAWTSPDGLRLVEISGPNAQAHLFDATANPASYIAFLGKDVQKVRFSAAAPGYPPTVAVEFRNGAAAVFDYDGRRLDAAKPASVKTPPPASDVPPAPPEDLPPPP